MSTSSKSSLTYLEVLLTMIIVMILASVTYPNLRSNNLDLAASRLLTDLKYVIYLATLYDNFEVSDRNFHGKLWQIRFHTRAKFNGKIAKAYTIFRDKNGNDRPDKGEFLKDALSGKDMHAFYKKGVPTNQGVFLSELYGVDGITFSKNCSKRGSQKLYFDKYGQVYINHNDKQANIVHNGRATFKNPMIKATEETCKITLKQSDRKVDICLETATSYSYLCKT